MHDFKTSLFACCSLGLLLNMWSCKVERTNSGTISLSPVNGIYIDSVKTQSSDRTYAICIYDKAGLRVEPTQKRYTSEGKDNYLETIRYGEMVEYLGETQEVEKERTIYMKVRLQDDQEGWAFEYAFEKDADRGAMIKASPLYRRPDLMTLRDDTLKPGEIVAVIQRQGDWLQVSGRNKGKKGWIQVRDNVSLREKDVYIALLFHKAKEAPESVRSEKLSNVLEDQQASGSLLKYLVEQALSDFQTLHPDTLEAVTQKIAPKPVRQAQKTATKELEITETQVELRAMPDLASGSLVGTLDEGTVCQILQQGQKDRVGNREDYWYEIEHKGQAGWVFGSQTSLKEIY